MATIRIDQFHGISPRTHPTLLADGMATVAHNVKLKNGKLVPLRQPSILSGISLILENGLTDIANAETIHVWKKGDGSCELILFPGITWASEGNIADDGLNRMIVSGDTGVDFRDSDGNVTHNSPQIYMRRSGNKYVHPLCKNPLPAPHVRRVGGDIVSDAEIVNKGFKTVSEINALTTDSLVKGWTYTCTDAGDIALGLGGALSVIENTTVTWNGSNWALVSDYVVSAAHRYTYFFVTWVDAYGYESPVSAASRITKDNGSTWVDADLEYMDGDSVKMEAFGSGVIPAEAVKVRIYKVITGTEDGRIQFVKETSATGLDTNPVNFTVKDEDAGEVLNEIESPFADLRCILDVPGAYYVGFSPSHPKTVCFSDVDLIYSWPIAYRYDIKDNIVALAVTSNTVFALTDGWPYVLSGTDPGGMTVTKLAGPAACVSERGVCVYKNAVYYAGQQGLMTIYNDADAGTMCANLTDKIFTKEQWLAFNPSSCVMGQFDGALHLFFTLADGSHKGLSIDLAENANAVTTHDEVAKCVCVDSKTDKMYYVREGV